MNLEVYFVFVSGMQNVVWQMNFVFSYVNVSCSYSVSDVVSIDGIEQFIFVVCFRCDSNGFQGVDFFCVCICSSQNVSQFSFQFSVMCFEVFNVFFGSWNSFILWYQEVMSIVCFNVNLIIQVIQVCYFIKQNNLYYFIFLKLY